MLDRTSRDEVHEQVVVDAPRSAVWEALVDGERRRRWWSYLDIDPAVGGVLTERWVGPDGDEVLTKGVVIDVVPSSLLRLTWADESWPAQTEVEVRLTPADRGTTVEVRHSGWGRLPDGERLAREHRAGWQLHLSDLRAHLER